MTRKAFSLAHSDVSKSRDQYESSQQRVKMAEFTRHGAKNGPCSEVYLIHNDSELESADSLDRFKSDDEAATDLKRNKSLFYRESEHDIGESNDRIVESGSDHRPDGG